jgi:hypothetical protein
VNDILLVAEYGNVRELFALSTTELPDATLSLLPYVPSVEAKLKARVTDWAAIIVAAGDNATRLKMAAVYGVAAALCQRWANALRPGDKLADSTLGQIDWREQEQMYRDKMEEALGNITTQTVTAPTLMALAGVSRAVAARRQAEEGTLDEDVDFENV